MKKVCVIGGGTVGWLTALYVKKFWKGVSVTLIASSKIGILGAGEGTTPNFGAILRGLGIDEVDFLTNTNSTIKIGNDFINWRGDGKNLVHGFNGPDSTEKYGYHFDARAVAEYFKNIGIKRKIKYIDANAVRFQRNLFGDVTTIQLNNNKKINTDFVFDCSGFNRLLIGKEYETEWISYENDLMVNAAFAYFIPQKEDLTFTSKTKTKSIAMNSGWMWQAPLQHRWGCGYVFNDNYISFEDAQKEVEEYIGEPIQIVKKFSFTPGSYKNVWMNNCIAIGLSGGFIEPLEATSIMSSIMQLKRLKEINFNSDYKDEYNDFVRNINEQNMLFLRYHYMCDRYDTPFWVDYNNKQIPPKLKNIIDDDRNLIIRSEDELTNAFDMDSDNYKIIFSLENYKVVYKKNSNKYKNVLI
jgi:tryptophan halogenase